MATFTRGSFHRDDQQWDARPHSDNTCSCLNQTVALASLIPSTLSVTFPNIASLGRSFKETWDWIEKCNSCGNRRQVADLMNQSVLKLIVFCEAACITYNLLDNQLLSPGASQQPVDPGGTLAGHIHSSYQMASDAFAAPTLAVGSTPPPVVCEKRPMRLQSYLLDDEEAELLALEIISAIVAKLSTIAITLQAWEFENESGSFGRGSAGPVSRVSVEAIQARVDFLIRNLRSDQNSQSSDDVGIM